MARPVIDFDAKHKPEPLEECDKRTRIYIELSRAPRAELASLCTTKILTCLENPTSGSYFISLIFAFMHKTFDRADRSSIFRRVREENEEAYSQNLANCIQAGNVNRHRCNQLAKFITDKFGCSPCDLVAPEELPEHFSKPLLEELSKLSKSGLSVHEVKGRLKNAMVERRSVNRVGVPKRHQLISRDVKRAAKSEIGMQQNEDDSDSSGDSHSNPSTSDPDGHERDPLEYSASSDEDIQNRRRTPHPRTRQTINTRLQSRRKQMSYSSRSDSRIDTEARKRRKPSPDKSSPHHLSHSPSEVEQGRHSDRMSLASNSPSPSPLGRTDGLNVFEDGPSQRQHSLPDKEMSLDPLNETPQRGDISEINDASETNNDLLAGNDSMTNGFEIDNDFETNDMETGECSSADYQLGSKPLTVHDSPASNLHTPHVSPQRTQWPTMKTPFDPWKNHPKRTLRSPSLRQPVLDIEVVKVADEHIDTFRKHWQESIASASNEIKNARANDESCKAETRMLRCNVDRAKKVLAKVKHKREKLRAGPESDQRRHTAADIDESSISGGDDSGDDAFEALCQQNTQAMKEKKLELKRQQEQFAEQVDRIFCEKELELAAATTALERAEADETAAADILSNALEDYQMLQVTSADECEKMKAAVQALFDNVNEVGEQVKAHRYDTI